MQIAIIGGGVAGLVAAYELAKSDVEVTVFEKCSELGGMAASFSMPDGQRIEKYYHFICKPDRAYTSMMRELGIHDRLRWATTRMALYYQGTLHTLDDPISLLRFRHLSLQDKIRFGRATLRSKFRNSDSWQDLEDVVAKDWLIDQYGEQTYDLLYRPLLRLKFRDYASDLSAAWMWARFHRLSNSRTVTQHERVGYVKGGTQLYVEELEKAIQSHGGHIQREAEVEEIMVEGGRVCGLTCRGSMVPCDWVIATLPTPALLSLLPNQNGPYFENLRSLQYLDVVTLVTRLKKRLTPYFWINISEPSMDMAGIIEYTNLNPDSFSDGNAVLYIPQYLPAQHPYFQMSGDQLLERYGPCLKAINPAFDLGWVRSHHVFRTRFAQPLCQVGFARHIPAMQTPIEGLYVLDSYQLHPHDRTISNATTQGQRVTALLLGKQGQR